MKKIFFILLLLPFLVNAQTDANYLRVRDSLRLAGKVIKGISNNSTSSTKDSVKLITEKAAKEYTDAHSTDSTVSNLLNYYTKTAADARYLQSINWTWGYSTYDARYLAKTDTATAFYNYRIWLQGLSASVATNTTNISTNTSTLSTHTSQITALISDSAYQAAILAAHATAIASKQNALGYTAEDAANKGASNGYAALVGGKIPMSYLPSTTMIFKGLWNAKTNDLGLANGSGTSGYVYQISMTQDTAIHNWFGIVDTFYNGDMVMYNGSSWEVTGNPNSVKSVRINGSAYQQGVVDLTVPNATITNAMLAGSIAASKLVGTDISLAESQITGLTSDLAAKLSATISSASTGQLIRYNGSAWVNWTPTYLTSYSETDPVYTASSWYTTTNNNGNWNSAYTDRMKWDGGSTGLVAATGRASLGLVIGTDVLAYRTFGSAANNNIGDFEVPLTFSTGLTRTGNTITNNITQYTDALARAAISVSGSLSYNSTTGVISYTTPTIPAQVALTGGSNISITGSYPNLTIANTYSYSLPGTVVQTTGSYSDPAWLTISASKVGLGNVTNNAQWYSGNHPTTVTGYGITDIATSIGLSSYLTTSTYNSNVSGTSNRLARFSGTNTLTTSLIQDNGTATTTLIDDGATGTRTLMLNNNSWSAGIQSSSGTLNFLYNGGSIGGYVNSTGIYSNGNVYATNFVGSYTADQLADANDVYVYPSGIVTYRKIMMNNYIPGTGYTSRIGVGIRRNSAGGWGDGVISIGTNDAGTTFQDYIFTASGNFIAKYISGGGSSISSFYSGASFTDTKVTDAISNGNDFIGGQGYWAFRTGTAHDFNLDVYNSASPINAVHVTQSGAMTVAGYLTASSNGGTSDARLKSIQHFNFDLKKLDDLAIYQWQWNDLAKEKYGLEQTNMHYSPIAQMIEKFAPELIIEDAADASGFKKKNVNFIELHNLEIERLKQRITALEKHNK